MEHIDAKTAMELVKGADKLPRAEIEALAQERLRFLINYARKHSPYLQEKYADLPEEFTLPEIPVSTRPEMVEHFDRWVCDPEIKREAITEYVSDFNNIFTPFLGKYAIASTSGTLFAIATPTPAVSSIFRSFFPSPNAIISSLFI